MLKATILVTIIIGIYACPPLVKNDDLQYYLYNTKTNREKLKCERCGKNFDPDSDVKMLLHGWGEDADTFWYSSTRNAYVDKGYNVILVNWSEHAQVEYHVAFLRVPLVADVIARFIIGLCKIHDLSLSKFHLIGHCMGAHVAGFTGKTIYSQEQEKIGRITGLDPTGHSFNHAKDTGRLAGGDAVNVDTIITDAGPQGLGLNCSVGHVNFFPNGGTAPQPGCIRYPCSHNRAAVYFREGIVSDQLVGKRCGTYANYICEECKNNHDNVLGDGTDFTIKGNFFLKTSDRSPFGLGNGCDTD